MNPQAIQEIHDTETLAVLAVTGGGSEAISELLRHGNGSKTLLEAVVPYDQGAFERFLGGKPDKFCSELAARQLAMAAYQRARSLAPEKPVIGVGASCSLAKDNERVGREHHVYVGLQTPDKTVSYSVRLSGSSRENEETAAATYILAAVREGCGLVGHSDAQRREVVASEEFQDLLHGRADVYSVSFRDLHKGPTLVFPGSFNPVHLGHAAVAHHAKKLTGLPVEAEISIKNVDKPWLDYVEMDARLKGLEGCPAFDGVCFTTAATFLEKAKIFEGDTFVVGSDTIERLANCAYHHGSLEVRDATLAVLAGHKARFLVYPRNGYIKGDYTKLPETLKKLCLFIEDFTQVDISSSEVRKQAH